MSCTNHARNETRCTCTYPGCSRHGVCCECVSFHKSAGELPGCFFSAAEERTYDRSAAFFVKGRR